MKTAGTLSLQTDWLNSEPVFVNTKTKTASRHISDVIDWANLEFDNEGLSNYLRFGYIVFNKTPFKNIEKLSANSSAVISVDSDGKNNLFINEHPDPVLDYIGAETAPEQCIELIRDVTNKLISENDEKSAILLPLSGGYDSRMLLSVVDDKSRLRAVTYDISLSQKYSFETLRAKHLCERLNVDWRQIHIGSYWSPHVTDKSFAIFGPEMSLQPSYHVEMYDQAEKLFGQRLTVLSGSVGDWWSGEKLPLSEPDKWEDCLDLFHTIGIAFSPEHLLLKVDKSHNEQCVQPVLSQVKESYLYRTVFSKRGRIGLASFINRVAKSYFPSVTPFYDIDVAMSQINLPPEQRKNREWQKAHFSSLGIDVDSFIEKAYSASVDNSLDLIAAHICAASMEVVDEKIFSGIVKKERIKWINDTIEQCARLPMGRFMAVAQKTFSEDNAQILPPMSRYGNYFDMVCPWLLDYDNLIQAVSEWSILMPLQRAVRIAEAGTGGIYSCNSLSGSK